MKTYTVSPWDFEMEVKADVDPGESMTFDHPGSPAMADIFHVYVGGVDILEMLSKEQVKRLEDHVLRQLGY